MRYGFVGSLVLAAAALSAASLPLAAEVDESAPVKIDSCASDDSHLGLSRVVEIDTTGGAVLGGERPTIPNLLNDGEVVLTFDDGPIKAYTRKVLDALADQCTKATFFMVGKMAVADPVMVKEVAKAGHTIGSHTWSHKNLRPTTLVRAKQEIESAISAITLANGAPIAPFFRFPYLASNKQADAYLKSRDIGAIWIDIDSKDYRTRDPKTVENRVMAQLMKLRKGIILMHDIQVSTSKMLPNLLEDLRVKGFKVVHLVPKTTVQTIASFDEIAEKALSAKASARARDPLAERSLVWTMAPSPGDAKPTRKRSSKSSIDSSSAAPVAPAVIKPKQPPAKAIEKPSLWDDIFQN